MTKEEGVSSNGMSSYYLISKTVECCLLFNGYVGELTLSFFLPLRQGINHARDCNVFDGQLVSVNIPIGYLSEIASLHFKGEKCTCS